jgi:23S rRNA (adenine2503-C2)-methyltransferase
VTVSTVGVVPGIERLSQEQDAPISLAVSLHAATDDLRQQLIPISQRYPLDDLCAALRRYVERTGRRVMIEWVMIAGVNDGRDQAAALVERLSGFHLPAHVNLIRLNPTLDYPARPASVEAVEAFAAVLDRADIPHTMRQQRGGAIAAGCGQLRRRGGKPARTSEYTSIPNLT